METVRLVFTSAAMCGAAVGMMLVWIAALALLCRVLGYERIELRRLVWMLIVGAALVGLLVLAG